MAVEPAVQHAAAVEEEEEAEHSDEEELESSSSGGSDPSDSLEGGTKKRKKKKVRWRRPTEECGGGGLGCRLAILRSCSRLPCEPARALGGGTIDGRGDGSLNPTQKKKKGGGAAGGGGGAAAQPAVDPAARKEGERRLQARRQPHATVLRVAAGGAAVCTEPPAPRLVARVPAPLAAATSSPAGLLLRPPARLLLTHPPAACLCLQEAVEVLSHNSEDGMWVKLRRVPPGGRKDEEGAACAAAQHPRLSPAGALLPQPARLDALSRHPEGREDRHTAEGLLRCGVYSLCTYECSTPSPLSCPAASCLPPSRPTHPMQLCEALQANTICISLDLSANQLTDEGGCWHVGCRRKKGQTAKDSPGQGRAEGALQLPAPQLGSFCPRAGLGLGAPRLAGLPSLLHPSMLAGRGRRRRRPAAVPACCRRQGVGGGAGGWAGARPD